MLAHNGLRTQTYFVRVSAYTQPLVAKININLCLWKEN